jgi:hypothetical protein
MNINGLTILIIITAGTAQEAFKRERILCLNIIDIVLQNESKFLISRPISYFLKEIFSLSKTFESHHRDCLGLSNRGSYLAVCNFFFSVNIRRLLQI